MSADYETAVLFERETVWRWHQNEDPVRLDWSGPVLTGDFDGHHRIALIRQGAIIVFGFDGKELQRFPAPKGATAIAWRKGHDELLVGRLDGGIVLLDLSGATIAEMTHHEGQISTLETSPDGAYLAAASWDATVSISALNYSPSAVSSTSFLTVRQFRVVHAPGIAFGLSFDWPEPPPK